uniref:Uncharacterized protein n=1 Tax=Arundo donax TaxID=35708 RepID=A0A0A9EP44_ARUDO
MLHAKVLILTTNLAQLFVTDLCSHILCNQTDKRFFSLTTDEICFILDSSLQKMFLTLTSSL